MSTVSERDTSTTRLGDAALLVFDGDCGFCARSVRAIQRWVRPVSVSFQPWQSLDLAALELTEDQVNAAVQWCVPAADGPDAGRLLARASGAAAIGHVLRRGRGPWPVVGVLLALPPVSWLAAVVYRLIARNRHRMPGGTAACALPSHDRAEPN
jgi:predicted DCC family thiol-disulfide oxidoreductase YuxK